MFYGIHGVGDGQFPADLTGPRFLALAARTTAYSGVMAARVAEQEQAQARPGQLTTQAGEDHVVDSTRAALAADQSLAGVVDFG